MNGLDFYGTVNVGRYSSFMEPVAIRILLIFSMEDSNLSLWTNGYGLYHHPGSPFFFPGLSVVNHGGWPVTPKKYRPPIEILGFFFIENFLQASAQDEWKLSSRAANAELKNREMSAAVSAELCDQLRETLKTMRSEYAEDVLKHVQNRMDGEEWGAMIEYIELML